MNNLKGKLVIVATLAAIALPVNTADAQGRKYFPSFEIESSCSHISLYVFAEIHLNVNRTLDDAIIAIESERSSKEYTTSFGKYDTKRHQTVRKRMNLIREGTYTAKITVRCEKPGQSVCKMTVDKGPLAKAAKQRGPNKGKYIVSLCPAFFEASDKRVQKLSPWSSLATMQGDIFLHEMVHFGWHNAKISVPRTEDWGYNIKGVEELAKDDPDWAIENADTYRIFMMKLAVRNRTIYR